MKLEINFDADLLINQVMANFPEASSCSLQCVSYDYDKCSFLFWDAEVTQETAEKSVIEATIQDLDLSRNGFTPGAVTYIVTLPDLRRGIQAMLQDMMNGKLAGVAQYVLPDFTDPGKWDACAADALAQYAIFGTTIYG